MSDRRDHAPEENAAAAGAADAAGHASGPEDDGAADGEAAGRAAAPGTPADGAETPEAPEVSEEESAADVEPTPLEQVTAERDELKERWLRAAAELENVRKRARREVAEARRFAQADLLRSLLEVADNLERALESLADAETGADAVRDGVTLIHQRFQAVLRERGVEPIEAADAPFDPNWHEAVAQQPSDQAEPGTVLEVVQQGYRFGDLVLRPARVVIAGQV